MSEMKLPSNEDALNILVSLLRAPIPKGHTIYGYEIYLPTSVKHYLNQKGISYPDSDRIWSEWSPVFYDAAWELCRRGILRPGVKRAGGQAVGDGEGYSITPFGRKWLEEADKDSFVPTEPERFGQLLGNFKDKFGPGFHERGQEAIRCYGAHAYLACCVMCGAAAESILLAIAVAKIKDEEEILKLYSGRDGRHKVENLFLGQNRLREQYQAYSGLLRYWRDSGAHGIASRIKEEEAFTSLALLLRFATFVSDKWAELTS